MTVSDLTVKNFRNLSEQKISFGNGVNVIIGNNGHGKTNILEAIYYFCEGRSHRGAKDREIIKFGEDFLRSEISFNSEYRAQNVRVSLTDKKLLLLNGVAVRKTSDLLGHVKCVLFTPDDMSVIKGSPGERRRFLDALITPLKPRYFTLLKSYKRILLQKNKALKEMPDRELIGVWNSGLAENAAEIIALRGEYTEILSKEAKRLYSEIGKKEDNLLVEYIPFIKLNEVNAIEQIKKAFNDVMEKEIRFKTSLIGIQRDELGILLNDEPLKSFGSQGQIRSAVLSLKLSQLYVMEKELGERPVLLLDDIMSELDKERREFLLVKIKEGQVIITCTDVDEFRLRENDRILRIEDGVANMQ